MSELDADSDLDSELDSERWKRRCHNCAPEVLESPPRFSAASDIWDERWFYSFNIINSSFIISYVIDSTGRLAVNVPRLAGPLEYSCGRCAPSVRNRSEALARTRCWERSRSLDWGHPDPRIWRIRGNNRHATAIPRIISILIMYCTWSSVSKKMFHLKRVKTVLLVGGMKCYMFQRI